MPLVGSGMGFVAETANFRLQSYDLRKALP